MGVDQEKDCRLKNLFSKCLIFQICDKVGFVGSKQAVPGRWTCPCVRSGLCSSAPPPTPQLCGACSSMLRSSMESPCTCIRAKTGPALRHRQNSGALHQTRRREGVEGSLHHPTIRTGSCTRGACITSIPAPAQPWDLSASPQGPDWWEHTVHHYDRCQCP